MTQRKTTPDILAERDVLTEIFKASATPTATLAPPEPNAALIRSQLKYDYSLIPEADRSQVQSAAIDIVRNYINAHESRIEIGKRLIEIKDVLEYGQFGEWCETEFQMSQRSAQRMMQVAEAFDGKYDTVSLLTDSALYLLAAPSTPEEAREEVIEQAKATGHSPTQTEVKAVIDSHKPAKPSQPPPVSPEQRQYDSQVAGIATLPAAAARRLEAVAAISAADTSNPPALPADLAGRGWELRHLDVSDKWYCHNPRDHHATDAHERPEDAIQAAYAMQRDLAWELQAEAEQGDHDPTPAAPTPPAYPAIFAAARSDLLVAITAMQAAEYNLAGFHDEIAGELEGLVEDVRRLVRVQ